MYVAVAVQAIWIAMAVFFPRKGRIYQLLFFVIEVYILNAGQCINDIDGVFKGRPVIGKHGMVEGSLHDGADIAAALLAHFIQVPFIDTPEDNSEGNKEEQGQYRYSNDDPAIDG
jgi:hypothetical protein